MFKNNNCITNRYHRLYSNKYLYGFLSIFVILQPCSQDQNCDILSQRYKVHITISASVLACLVNNHAPNYDREWEIPFTVRDYQLQGVYSHPLTTLENGFIDVLHFPIMFAYYHMQIFLSIQQFDLITFEGLIALFDLKYFSEKFVYTISF